MAIFSNITFLVVEDDSMLSLALQKRLTSMGAKVDAVSSGADVDAKVAQNDYSLILLDIGLPFKDGFTVLKELKANPKTLHIPVILLTNYGEMDFINRGTSLGAADYLIKSNTSLEKLQDILSRYLH